MNPILVKKWGTPFEIPPFEVIRPEHFGEAFDWAFRDHEREIEEICANLEIPSFKNTVEALEGAGRDLDRVASIFFNLTSAHTSPELQKIEKEIAPLSARHSSKIFTNPRLFARIEQVVQKVRDQKEILSPEQNRLLERIHQSFVRSGARLDEMGRKRMGEILERLAFLGTQFAQNILKDEVSFELVIDSEEELKGLPSTWIEAAHQEAHRRGKSGKWVITLSRSSVEPCLVLAENRKLREKLFRAFSTRGEGSGRDQNPAIIAETVQLRLERARLLGYSTFAEYKLDDTMAKRPEEVRKLLLNVWTRAVEKIEQERPALTVLASRDELEGGLQPWDWRFYAEKQLRLGRTETVEGDFKDYLQLDRMIEAAFDVAQKLFGVRFLERTDLPKYHPDVRTWEVLDQNDRHVGVFFGDYFARPSKRSGAWMSKFRVQNRLHGVETPIIVNVLNCIRGADGKPTLISMDDAHTIFHELGHGLHGLLSNVTYPTLSGTAVVRDFVELPSQLLEHWVERPEVLSRFATHWKTGEPLPEFLLKRRSLERTFGQALATVEFVSSAIVDLEVHSLAQIEAFDVDRFEKETLDKIGMPRTTVMRHRPAHFAHAFSGDGYSAGYYSYLWAEVLDADAFAAFEETGDVFHSETASKLKDYIYSAGNLRTAEQAYLGFRGKMPSVEPLLKKRGLIP